MTTNKLNTAMLALLALLAHGSAHAAETESACKLRGGSIVPLPAEACAKEGGVMVTVTTAPAAAAAAPAAAVPAAAPAPQLSADPKLAAAQKPILDLLNKPVTDTGSTQRIPEGIERSAKFDGCKLMVDENIHLDYGNVFSERKDFKISSAVDFRSVKQGAYGVFGEVASTGGHLKARAVYLEEKRQQGGNNLSISVSYLSDGEYKKFALPGPAAYWDGPRYDLWLADQYGYPRVNVVGSSGADQIATDTVRVLYIVNTADEAAALKKAFEDMHAACKP